MLGITLKLFHFQVGPRKAGRKSRFKFPWRRKSRDESAPAPISPPVVNPVFDNSGQLKQFATRVRFEVRSVVKSVPFVVILALGVANTLGAMINRGGIYGTDLLPVTRAMINAINGSFTFMILMIVIYYSAELVWRERQARTNEIIDATPAPSWAFVVSKLARHVRDRAVHVRGQHHHCRHRAGLRGLFQLRAGPVCAAAPVLPEHQPVPGVHVLAIFVQVLTNNKYFGMLLMVLYIISTIVMNSLGFEHNLYQFGGRPGAPISDMNASGHFIYAGLWFDLYWGFFSVMLAVLAYLMWNRGAIVRARQRLQQIRIAATPVSASIFGIALAGFVATGGYIYYNTNVLNPYITEESAELHQIEYEEKFRQYEFMPQPRIVDVSTEVDIYPDELRYDMRGRYIVQNRSDEPMTEVHTVLNPQAEVHELEPAGRRRRLAG